MQWLLIHNVSFVVCFVFSCRKIDSASWYDEKALARYNGDTSIELKPVATYCDDHKPMMENSFGFDNEIWSDIVCSKKFVNCIEPFIRTTPLLSQVEKQSEQQLTKPSG